MYAGAKPRPAGAMTNDSDQSAGFPGGGAKAGTWNLFVIAPDGTASPAVTADRFTYTA